MSHAHRAKTTLHERLLSGGRVPGSNPLDPALLASAEPRWARGIRAVRTPAVGLAVMTYLAGAWIAVGLMSPHPTPAEEPTTGGDTTPATAMIDVPAQSGGPGATPLPEGLSSSSKTAIDPQFFDHLQQVLNGLDTHADRSQTSAQPDRDEPPNDSSAGSAAPGGGPLSDAQSTATTAETSPPAPRTDEVGGVGAPTSDMPAPGITPDGQPGSPAIAPTLGQPAGTPAPATAPDVPAPAPAPDGAPGPQAVAAPGGQPPVN